MRARHDALGRFSEAGPLVHVRRLGGVDPRLRRRVPQASAQANAEQARQVGEERPELALALSEQRVEPETLR
jgi:hypothetical protein